MSSEGSAVSRLRRSVQAGITGLADVVFPPRCAGCGHRGVWVCDECFPGVALIEKVGCERCGVPAERPCACDELDPALDMVRSSAIYDSWLRNAIQYFKYDGERARVHHLAGLAEVTLSRFGGDVTLVPVPLHPKRRARRGYNQSELLAYALADRASLPVANLLRRRIATRRQVGLSAPERADNVRGAFAVTETDLSGERLVLIDDVLTTGATLGACAFALKQCGATWVGALTLAREL